MANSLRNALSKPGFSKSPPDVVCIIQEFRIEALGSFIEEAKQSPVGKDAAFVLVATEADAEKEQLSATIPAGFDALLPSPFSVEQIKELVLNLDGLRRERTRKQLESILLTLVNNVYAALSQAIKKMRQQDSCNDICYELRELCQPLAGFDDATLMMFHELLIERLENIAPPKKLRYDGASSRVRKKFEESARQPK